MQKKIIFTGFIALCLFGGIYWFLYTKEARTPVKEGINTIPADAAIIFESKQAKNTWKKLSQTNIMWEELLGTETFAGLNLQARYIDSLLQLNPEISALLDEHSVYISAHPSESSSFRFLFVYSLPNRTYRDEIEDFFETATGGKEVMYSEEKGMEIGTIEVPGKKPLWFSFVDGNLIMSTDKELAIKSIEQSLSKQPITQSKNFRNVLDAAGKKVDANLYLNYKNFPTLLGHFILPEYKKDITSLTGFADCSGWDITVKPNAMMLSGFTATNDSGNNFLDIFSKQKPQTIEITKVIPHKTALMIFYGISNTKAFHNDHLKYLEATKMSDSYKNFSQRLRSDYHLDPEEMLWDLIDNEIALVVTEPSSTDLNANSYAVMHSNNIVQAVDALNSIADSARKEDETIDTTSFRGHAINRIRIRELLPQLFGWQFSRITEPYFTSINNYLIFGNSENDLRNFISDFENNKTLANDKNYQAFAENISAESNLYIYSAIGRSTNIYKKFITDKFSSDIEKHLELFHKFESAAIQFSVSNKLFYSNIYVKYNPVYKQETGTLWESQLDSTLSSRPYLLINHNTKAKEVFVQDEGNKIYLISNTGKVIWTKQLHEKIMSDVIQVDVLKNNKLQLVFNTRSAIYMFDRNGNDMKGFPIKLNAPASNAISVIDYENNRDYRIFIATDNKKINCYKSTGEIVTGFEFDKTSDPVYLPVQYFNTANKDHLCAIDVKGKIYILDRHGKTRLKLDEQMAQGIRNFFIETGKDYSRTTIVAADTLGNIIRISLNNNKEKIRFQEFETSPYFEYRDINSDKTKEYIFLTRNELKVFNTDRSLLFNYEFSIPVSQVPQFFLFPDGSGKIGVTCEVSSELYLFNDNGSLYTGFPLKGKTAFSIGDLNNEGTFNIVTGSTDNSIYVYTLQ
jgi:hypothetical protein